MKIRPAVIIQEHDKIMLMRYHYSGKDVFQFPGGNTEDVESLEETLVREMNEELQIEVAIQNLFLAAQVINTKKGNATLHCLFSASKATNQIPVLNPEHTSALEIRWVEIKLLDTLNLYPAVGKQLKNILLNHLNTPQYLGVIDQPWF